jgi:hypothetical protein
MQRKTITITFEGHPSEDGNVRLGDLMWGQAWDIAIWCHP